MKQHNVDYYQYVEDILKPEDVHTAHTHDYASANNGLFLISAVILTLLHGLITYFALDGVIAGYVFVLFHLIFSGVAAFLAWGQYRAGIDAPFFLLLAISTSVMGLFGALGTLFCFVLHVLFRQGSLSFNEWFATIFPRDIQSEAEEIYDDIVLGRDENPRDYGVMPFIEVMSIGSDEQKRRALSKMTLQFHARLAPAFQKALRDESNAIRVQAATAVAKIESQFMRKLERIELARRKAPNNTHLLFALAKYYDDYAYTGLLDPERESMNRQKAIETYKEYLQHDPNSIEAWASIGRLLFRSKDWEEAAEWFRHALDRGWRSTNMIMWYFESLYHLQDYRALRRAMVEYGSFVKGNENLPPSVSDAVELWSGRA
ncbi:MAG: hypothetical protein CMM94_07930 [Rickettsiales bacterium]|nr:hypothetical protein [Rickettsiales bacterium]